ncbi:unnamed protein product [Toxocara canis]|uniref:Protein FAM43A n=1 Tax=Toxocara canis TaxID=6265 RepID=A0A183TVR6_TOXCA|nr:unnamed protein product [Toxocara canis]
MTTSVEPAVDLATVWASPFDSVMKSSKIIRTGSLVTNKEVENEPVEVHLSQRGLEKQILRGHKILEEFRHWDGIKCFSEIRINATDVVNLMHMRQSALGRQEKQDRGCLLYDALPHQNLPLAGHAQTVRTLPACFIYEDTHDEYSSKSETTTAPEDH